MFTSLYVKTNYSLLSSLVSIDNLILYAVEHKLSALAICDDNMTSTKIFYDKCIKNNIKPIIGLDLKYKSDLNAPPKVVYITFNGRTPRK